MINEAIKPVFHLAIFSRNMQKSACDWVVRSPVHVCHQLINLLFSQFEQINSPSENRLKACFIRRIFSVSNAFQTIDN